MCTEHRALESLAVTAGSDVWGAFAESNQNAKVLSCTTGRLLATDGAEKQSGVSTKYGGAGVRRCPGVGQQIEN